MFVAMFDVNFASLSSKKSQNDLCIYEFIKILFKKLVHSSRGISMYGFR